MTVVVAIFLIAMVVLLVRNIELVNQLRATMEAERIAAELARATGEEKDTLSANCTAPRRVQQMQLEIMRLQDKGLRSESLIAEQLRAITGLTNERDDLARQAAQLALLRDRLQSDVERRQRTPNAHCSISTSARSNSTRRNAPSRRSSRVWTRARSRITETRRMPSDLQRTIDEQRTSLEQQRQDSQDVERRYLVLAETSTT